MGVPLAHTTTLGIIEKTSRTSKPIIIFATTSSKMLLGAFPEMPQVPGGLFPNTERDRGIELARRMVSHMRLMAHAFGQVDTETTVQNPEWTEVIVDADDRILAGIKVDGTIFIAEI